MVASRMVSSSNTLSFFTYSTISPKSGDKHDSLQVEGRISNTFLSATLLGELFIVKRSIRAKSKTRRGIGFLSRLLC